MTPSTPTAGRLAAPGQHAAPPHYLRRMARLLVIRAAVSGRLSWPAALLVLRRLEVAP